MLSVSDVNVYHVKFLSTQWTGRNLGVCISNTLSGSASVAGLKLRASDKVVGVDRQSSEYRPKPQGESIPARERETNG